MSIIRNVVIIMAIFTANISIAKPLEPVLQSQIEQLLNQINRKHDFNGSMAIKIDNHPIYTYSTGYQTEKVKLTTHHLFSSGSVGKEFTTTAILKLTDSGKLQLTDKLSEYIPNLPEWAQTVKIEHLLSHTSGLPRIKWKKNITTADVMAQITALKALEFKPGTQYLYGNINVMLRALILEEVAGLSFDEYLKLNFFTPLKMYNTLQVTEITELEQKVPGDYPTAINGVTIYTTPSDLIRWELGLLDGRAINGKSFLRFVSEHPLSGKSHHIEYDFGQFFTENGKVKAIQHDGSNPSHHVLKYTNLTDQFSFVAMSSDGNKKTLYLLKDKIESLIQTSKLAYDEIKGSKSHLTSE